MLPRSEDPARAADALSEAAHDLALATRRFADPADSYQVLGNLQTTLFGLQQTLEQVAALHQREAARAATDAGDREVGRAVAEAAAERLTHAAAAIDHATDELMAGFAHNGRIAWQPAHDPVGAVLTARGDQLPDGPGSTPPSDPRPPSLRR